MQHLLQLEQIMQGWARAFYAEVGTRLMQSGIALFMQRWERAFLCRGGHALNAEVDKRLINRWACAFMQRWERAFLCRGGHEISYAELSRRFLMQRWACTF